MKNKNDKHGIISIRRNVLTRKAEIIDIGFTTHQAGSIIEEAISKAKSYPLSYFVFAIYETEKHFGYKPIGVGTPSFGFVCFVAKEGVFRFRKPHSLWFVLKQMRRELK